MPLYSKIANYLRSATTIVDVQSATAPTNGQVLTATGPTAATWQTPSGSAFTPSIVFATILETTGRFTDTKLNGTNSFGTNGLVMLTSSTANRRCGVQTQTGGSNNNIFIGSPVITSFISVNGIGTAGFFFVGLGDVQGTITVNHIGFKIEFTAGPTATLYGSQADGTTESKTAALTTFAASNDEIEVCAKVNGTSSVDYYWRKNGGSWSSATNLTTNMPGAASQMIFDTTLNNAATATANTVTVCSYSYVR